MSSHDAARLHATHASLGPDIAADPALAPTNGPLFAQVAICNGNPIAFAQLLARLPRVMHQFAIADGQRMFGNGFVQTALAHAPNAQGAQTTVDAPAPPPPSSPSHVTPGLHAPKSPSHVTPGSHPTKSQSHVTPHSHDVKSQSHVTPGTHPTNTPGHIEPGARDQADGAPTVSYAHSQELDLDSGETVTRLGVGIEVSSGEGPINYDASSGNLTVGQHHLNVNVLDPRAVMGKGLDVEGTGVTTQCTKHSKTSLEFVPPDIAGVNYAATWQLEGDGWTATLSLTAFAGFKLPDQGPTDGPDLLPSFTPEQIKALARNLIIGAGVTAAGILTVALVIAVL